MSDSEDEIDQVDFMTDGDAMGYIQRAVAERLRSFIEKPNIQTTRDQIKDACLEFLSERMPEPEPRISTRIDGDQVIVTWHNPPPIASFVTYEIDLSSLDSVLGLIHLAGGVAEFETES